MRVLVVGQHYWPEPFDLAVNVCEGLAARGHDVTMLTGMPNYPEGELYAGFEANKDHEERRNGVRILRTRIHPRKTGAVHRVWNYYSFSKQGKRRARVLQVECDVVISLSSSPVMMSNPAIAYAKRACVPLLIYVIDIWPECLVAGGIRPGSSVYKHFRKVSRTIYSSADKLLVTSPAFAGYLRDQVGVRVPTAVLPQYAEDVFGKTAAPHPSYDPAKVNFTFAGNVGAVQSVDTIVRAAALLREDDRIVFHIVGAGTELASCRELAKEANLHNVVFHGRHPVTDMPAFYAASDAMLLTFANDALLSLTLPRKMQSYMAAGKPVIAAAAGEARRTVEAARCGYSCPPEDEYAFSAACKRFADAPQTEKDAMGRSAWAYYEAHYSEERFFATLENEMSAAVKAQ